MLEVFMDNMIVKYGENQLLKYHFTIVFNHVLRINMILNFEKCTFRFKVGKLVIFYFIERDIVANLDKCGTIIKMETPFTKTNNIEVKLYVHHLL